MLSRTDVCEIIDNPQIFLVLGYVVATAPNPNTLKDKSCEKDLFGRPSKVNAC